MLFIDQYRAAAVGPTVTIEQAAGQADPGRGFYVDFDILFSETVNGFTAADLTPGISGTATVATRTLVDANPAFTLHVAMKSIIDQTLTVSVPATVATAVSNGAPNQASTSTDNTVTWNPVVGTIRNTTNLTFASYLAKLGDFVFISTTAGVAVIDVSDPTNPVIDNLITHAFLGGQNPLAIKDDHLIILIAGETNGAFVVYDVTDPTTPTLEFDTIFAELENVTDLLFDGDNCFVSGGSGDFSVWNFSTVTSPSLTVAITHASITGGPMVKNGNYIYIAGVTKLEVVNVTTLASPSFTTSVSYGSVFFQGRRGTVTVDTYAFVTIESVDRLQVFNGSTASAPTSAGSLTDSTWFNGCAGIIDYDTDLLLVAADINDSVALVSTLTPTSPTVEAGGRTTGSAVSTSVLNGAVWMLYDAGLLYVSCLNDARLTIMEV